MSRTTQYVAQALGKLYSLMGDRERGEQCYSRAEAAFLESANAGEVHYYHHLADLYLHGQDKPVAALEWARKDWELRDNFSTQAVLALALYRNGKLEDAANLIDRALESGVSDVHVSSTAAKIYKSLGREAEAKTYAARTAQSGSVHHHFHVHH